MVWRLVAWVALVAELASPTVVLGGCASAPQPSQAAARTGSLQKGRASYYADSLAGNSTASGEPYDPKALTAAHRTLPFGTWVLVSRPGKAAVRVRINDRGPFGNKDRIIDLSRAAAEELDMVRAGVVEVTVQIVD
jgi:rare lipoprotein A